MYLLFCFTVYENIALKCLWSTLYIYDVSNKYVYFSISPLAQFAVHLMLSAPGVIVSNQDFTYIYILYIIMYYLYVYVPI